MRKSVFLFTALILVFSACSNASSYVRMNVLPDIEYPVYKQRMLMDEQGNVIRITFLGCSRTEDESVNAFILWELKKKVTATYKITFIVDGGDSEFFIRTASEKRIPLTGITRGAISPSVRKVKLGDCGLVILNFTGFNPVKDSPFDLVEGGRTSAITAAAYKNYIASPIRWSFRGCIAGKRGVK